MIRTAELLPLANRTTRGTRYYWSDPEKARAAARERMKGKQSKAAMTPEAWRRRLDMGNEGKRRRDADPAYRVARLAKQLAYYHSRKVAA